MKIFLTAVVAISAFSILPSFQGKPSFDMKSSITRGKEIYTTYCISCHMEKGEGIEDVYPPLAKSDYLMANKKRSIQQVLYGVNEPMTINGKQYALEMTGFDLSDQDVSDVLNYVRNSFGNKGDAVTPGHVRAARK